MVSLLILPTVKRHETRVDDGTYEIAGNNGFLSIGPFDDIVAELGETYEIEYDDAQAAVPWLDTHEGILQIDVRDQVPELTFDDEFVEIIENTPPEHRVGVFTDLIDRIWSSKGNLEEY